MEIWGCQCLKRIKIFSLPKLVEIKVHNNDLERFELEESNLHYLCITEKHISELKLLPLKNLKKLCLDMPNLTEKWLHYHLSGLPLLETLELTSCYMLKRIKLQVIIIILNHWDCRHATIWQKSWLFLLYYVDSHIIILAMWQYLFC